MGGRGSYSYSGKRSAKDGSTLSAYAVASLNKGTAGGTTVESAIARFREQLMDNRYEHSAYIDDAGYVHALGSTGNEGSTRVAPLSAVAHEKGVSTSNEGTYSALVTKSVSGKAVKSAAKRADASVMSRKYQSEIAMWRAMNKAYTSEFAKIGIEISYEKQPKKSGLLVTQKTGTYA